MKSYSAADVAKAMRDIGVARGDVVFFCAKLFPLGRLLGASNKDQFNNIYLETLLDLVGDTGTLVVPTYTQQVARYGLPYVHEETPTPTGIFNEFVRTRPKAVRSFHPVFSLTAIGAKAEAVCGNVSTNAFGALSAYDFLFREDALAISLGFHLNDGKLTSGLHYLETTFGVPYYYNKIVTSEVFRGGQLSKKVFTINVRYREFGIRYSLAGFQTALQNAGAIRSAALGDAMAYSCRMSEQMKIGYKLLDENVYALLDAAPNWERGRIPLEGAEETLSPEQAAKLNWAGIQLHGWK